MRNILKFFGTILFLLIIVAGLVVLKLHFSVKNICRLDEGGYLYSMDYTGSYYDKLIRAPYQLMKSGGCSAFTTYSDEGDALTCRNYDLPHKDEEGNITGLNIMIRMNPKNGYASINMADASWLGKLGIPYYNGALDDGKTTKLLLAFTPYLCMDGMNEKGLTSSILYLDVKAGESAVAMDVAGLEKITINEMNRFIIDKCATVEEAVELAKQYNLRNILKSDYHIYVTDAQGNAAALEWRYNTLTVTYTNAITNFYVGYDDGEDCYKGDALKEKFVKYEDTTKEYHFGYGHGYNRFNTMIETLEKHITDKENYRTEMTYDECRDLLSSVAQEYDGSLTSYTQYSCIYNQTDLTLDVYSQQDYSTVYHFSFAE